MIENIKDDILQITQDCEYVSFAKLYQWYQKYIFYHRKTAFRDNLDSQNLHLLISEDFSRNQNSRLSLSLKYDKIMLVNTSPLLAPYILEKLKLRSWILTWYDQKFFDFSNIDLCMQNLVKFVNKLDPSMWKLHVSIWEKGPNDVNFNFWGDAGASNQIWIELADSVYEIAKIKSQGILLIFPNRNMINDWILKWNEKDCYKRISSILSVHLEPTKTSQYVYIFNQFKHDCGRKGSIMMVVWGSQFYEMILSSVSIIQIVVFVGIPFSPNEQFRVALRQYSMRDDQITF